MSITGKIFKRHQVKHTDDIDRVVSLESRVWTDIDDLEELIEDLSEWLKTPQGTQRLKPIQAATLLELADLGGVLAPIRVGGGKTLISLLAARVTEAKKPMLIVPAALRDKTLSELAEYRKNWVIKPPIMESFERLSREDQAQLLHTVRPDLLILDECHKVKNKKAAATKRIDRYMQDFPDTKVCAMSGTITQRSLFDYAHILEWTHGKTRPVPLRRDVLTEWSQALDEKIPDGSRLAAGALMLLAMNGEEDSTEGARKAYSRRLTTTPGVVASCDKPLPFALNIKEIKFNPPPQMEEYFSLLREDWETPDGHPCSDGIEVWRHARELACGFFYVWDPRPPPTTYEVPNLSGDPVEMTWLETRRTWCQMVRYVLNYNRSELDTEKQVKTRIKRGDFKAPPGLEGEFDPLTLLTHWEEKIFGEFTPNTKAVWYDRTMIDLCIDWANTHDGIIWVEHAAFGRRLSKTSGLPYYGRGGLDSKGRTIEDARGPIVASIASNGTGRNLQHYAQNLVVSMPGNGATWEQLLGRTHRDGQRSKEVNFDLVIACREQSEAFWQAYKDAKYIGTTTGQIQKLCYANLDVTRPTNNNKKGSLWD